MNRQEIRNKAKRRREREVAKKKIIILMMATLFLVIIGFVIVGNNLSSSKVNARSITEEHKEYKSIVIEAGETLWSIADTYGPTYLNDKREYVQEIMEVNGLSTEEIYQGQHLIVVYYEK